jgi:hypothetical protein
MSVEVQVALDNKEIEYNKENFRLMSEGYQRSITYIGNILEHSEREVIRLMRLNFELEKENKALKDGKTICL